MGERKADISTLEKSGHLYFARTPTREGFVQQHNIFVTHANDFVGRMDVCFVAYTRDGMLSRIYEYFDVGQIEKFLGPSPAKS